MTAARLIIFTFSLNAVASCGQKEQPSETQNVIGSTKLASGRPSDPGQTSSLNSDSVAYAKPQALSLDPPTQRFIAATAEDEAWFAQVEQMSACRPVISFTGIEQDDSQWQNFGYCRQHDGSYAEMAPLIAETGPLGLTPTHSDEMPGIDAVAIITVDRNNSQVPYIYQTLRSVFSTFPKQTQINILVGDARTDFVQPQRLSETLSSDEIARVHVWPTDEKTHTFLHEHFIPERRGGWNYARALRSYKGHRGLILMEDDVQWSKGALSDINRLIVSSPLATTFYNVDCYGAQIHNITEISQTILHPVAVRDFKFVGTQGMYFSAAMANRLGKHIQRRIHERGWDFTIQLLFERADLQLGYMLPSLVQHTGIKSAGITPYFHQTACFADDIFR